MLEEHLNSINKRYARNQLEQQIHYIGVGCANPRKMNDYMLDYDQEYPIFLRNFKNNNFDTEIYLILIDPLIEEPPCCIRDYADKLEPRWEQHNNIYINNDCKIYIYTYKLAVNYDNNDFINFMNNYISYCSNNRHLLFYHDYTNCYINNIKKLNNDYNNIMIGISHDRIQNNCTLDLSLLSNQPVILHENNLFIIWNPCNKTNLHEIYTINKNLQEIDDINLRIMIYIKEYIKDYVNNIINIILPLYNNIKNKDNIHQYHLDNLYNEFNFYIEDNIMLSCEYIKNIFTEILHRLSFKLYGNINNKVMDLINIFDISNNFYVQKSLILESKYIFFL